MHKMRRDCYFYQPRQQTVEMPMGMKCAPLLADLFLYSAEAEYFLKASI
jgi:hypothetical protein